jgi:hypothetical protein
MPGILHATRTHAHTWPWTSPQTVTCLSRGITTSTTDGSAFKMSRTYTQGGGLQEREEEKRGGERERWQRQPLTVPPVSSSWTYMREREGHTRPPLAWEQETDTQTPHAQVRHELELYLVDCNAIFLCSLLSILNDTHAHTHTHTRTYPVEDLQRELLVELFLFLLVGHQILHELLCHLPRSGFRV